jgi:hypothetical protein
MFNVGGWGLQREEFIHCFGSVTSILCCTTLSEYDQVLLEESKTISRHFGSSFGCSLLIHFRTVEPDGGVSRPL